MVSLQAAHDFDLVGISLSDVGHCRCFIISLSDCLHSLLQLWLQTLSLPLFACVQSTLPKDPEQ